MHRGAVEDGGVGVDILDVRAKVCAVVQEKHKGLVAEAVGQPLLGIKLEVGARAGEALLVAVGCLTDTVEGGFGPEDEDSYYSDEEEPDAV